MHRRSVSFGIIEFRVFKFQDEFQIFVTGIALGLRKIDVNKGQTDNEPIFKLEEEHTVDLHGASTTTKTVSALRF